MKVIKKHLFRLYEFLYILVYRILYLKKHIYLAENVKFNKQTIFGSNIKIYKNVQIKNSSIGTGTYIGWYSNYNGCQIGRFCSIAPYSEVIYGRHPSKEFVSTHPAFFSLNQQAGFTFVNKSQFKENIFANDTDRISVIVGNDVWIGYGANILEGITIGDGAIIAAGSVVTKNVDPYAIVGGVPAKLIDYRFSKDEINYLLSLKLWERDFSWIRRNADLFRNIKNFKDLISC